MSNIAPLLDRNRAFAADPGARAGMPRLPFVPNLGLYIVTCIDPRVDPAQILGVRLGEAVVQRDIGGRITPAILRDIAHAHLVQVERKAPHQSGGAGSPEDDRAVACHLIRRLRLRSQQARQASQ